MDGYIAHQNTRGLSENTLSPQLFVIFIKNNAWDIGHMSVFVFFKMSRFEKKCLFSDKLLGYLGVSQVLRQLSWSLTDRIGFCVVLTVLFFNFSK